jgi:hypothetical protein
MAPRTVGWNVSIKIIVTIGGELRTVNTENKLMATHHPARPTSQRCPIGTKKQWQKFRKLVGVNCTTSPWRGDGMESRDAAGPFD